MADALIPRETSETFGELLRPGETPAKALRRLERRKDYLALIETDEGQKLLEAAQSDDKAARYARGTASSLAPESIAGQYLLIAIDRVDVEGNVREDLGDLVDLAASIAQNGVLEPIHVHRTADRYVVDVGHRRLAAAKLAGDNFIPAIVDAPALNPGAGERTVIQLLENIQREDLNALEEAKALRAILDADPGLSQKALADRLGRSQPWIANTLGILKTDPKVQQLVATGQLSAAHLKAIAGLAPKTQVELAKSAVDRGTSAHGMEDLVQQHKRSEEWRKEQAARSRREAEEHRAALEAGVANLAKKKVALDAPIRVIGYGEADLVVELIRKAEYSDVVKVRHGEIEARPSGVDCDCTAWKVTAEYGRMTIAHGCTNGEHRVAKTQLEDAARVARNQLETRVQVALAEAAPTMVHAVELPGEEPLVGLHPFLARMALWHALDWQVADWAQDHGGKRANPWPTIAALDTVELGRELAGATAKTFRDRYGYHVPWGDLPSQAGIAIESPEAAA